MTKLTGINIYDLLNRHEEFATSLANVDDALFVDWLDMIDQAYWETAQDVVPEAFIKEGAKFTITSANLTETVADLHSINSDGCGVFRLDSDDNIVNSDASPSLIRTKRGSPNFGFWINDTIFTFTPITLTSSTDLKIRYIPDRTIITAKGNSLLIDTQYKAYALNAIKVLYQIWDENPSAAAITDNRFVNAMDKIWKSIRPDRSNSMEQFNNMY